MSLPHPSLPSGDGRAQALGMLPQVRVSETDRGGAMIATPPAEHLEGARNVLRQLGRELVALGTGRDVRISDLGLDCGVLASRAEHLRREIAAEEDAESIGRLQAEMHTWLPDDDCRGGCPLGRCTCDRDAGGAA
jgi:hypothetical protein